MLNLFPRKFPFSTKAKEKLFYDKTTRIVSWINLIKDYIFLSLPLLVIVLLVVKNQLFYTLLFLPPYLVFINLKKSFTGMLIIAGIGFFIGFLIILISYLSTVKSILPPSGYYQVKIKDIKNTYAIVQDQNNVKYIAYQSDFSETFRYGDILKGIASFEEVTKKYNSTSFDFKKYLWIRDINFVLKPEDSDFTISSNGNVRNWISDYLVKTVQNKQLLSIAKLVLFNWKDDDSKIISENFQNLNILHLIVVSGFHIGIVYLILNKVLVWIKINRFIRLVIVFGIIYFYCYLLGFSTSSLRSFGFLLILNVRNCLSKKVLTKSDLLSIVFLGFLITNWKLIYDLGFQLSFMMTLTIIQLSKYLKKYPSFLRVLTMTILTSLVSSSIIFCHNFYFNFFSWIYNFVFSFFVAIYYVFILFGIWFSFIQGFLVIYTNVFIKLVEVSLLFNFVLSIPKMSTVFYIILLFIFWSLNLFLNFHTQISLSKKLSLSKQLKKVFFVICTNYSWPLIPKCIWSISNLGTMTINFINIGQGNAIFVQNNIDHTNFFIDVGQPIYSQKNFAKTEIIPYLRSKNVHKIDAVFLTHNDYDHVGSLENVQSEFTVNNVYRIEKKQKSYQVGNTTIKNLSFFYEDDSSNTSLVLALEIMGFNFLFPGDMEKKEEDWLLKNNLLEHFEVVSVPHHGSKTSSSFWFINEIQPNFAIISVGKNNYNHPSPEILERYIKAGVKVYTTQNNGTVEIMVKNSELTIKTTY